MRNGGGDPVMEMEVRTEIGRGMSRGLGLHAEECSNEREPRQEKTALLIVIGQIRALGSELEGESLSTGLERRN
jgi:hypothetical protein